MNATSNIPADTKEKLMAHVVNGLVSSARAAEYHQYRTGNTYAIWARGNRIPGAVKLGRDWMLPIEWVLSQPQHGERRGPGGPRGKRLA